MNTLRTFGHALMGVLIAAVIAPTSMDAAEQKKYIGYEMFKNLMAAAPEIKKPALIGMAPAGMDMWAKGQMRVPAETHLFEGDFNGDGKREIAVGIAEAGKTFLLIAEPVGASFSKKGLIAIGDKGVREFNGRAFVIDEQTFVAWDGGRYKFERGPLAVYANAYETSGFGGVTVKLTYVGPQDEPYPGLLLGSFYRWPDLNQFKAHRTKGVSYGNDDMPVLWHLALSPQNLQDFARMVNRSDSVAKAEDRKGTEGGVSHSLSMIDSFTGRRPNYYEVFLNSKETSELLQTFAPIMEKKNAEGAKLLREYAKMFGS